VFDPAALTAAMDGQGAVYCNLSVRQVSGEKGQQPEREGIDNIITASHSAGIRRIACISSLVHRYEGMNGFHWWAFRIKHRGVKQIKGSGIPYSIFYPSTFMETLDHQLLRGNKLVLTGKSKAPMWFIAARDYAKLVVKALHIAGNSNQEFVIQEAEPFTMEEAVIAFIKNYSKPVTIMKVPLGLLKCLGLFNWKMNYAANICEALNKHPEKFESETTWKKLGKPETTLENYSASL
jgi:uncharacterized protein YbjT (DUF2867 family)